MRAIHHQNERGVSMVELIVTMAVALILTSMAFSSLSLVLDRSRENKDVLAFEGQLREARSMARARLRQVDVSYDSGVLTIAPFGETPTLFSVGSEITSVVIDDLDGVVVYNSQGGLNEAVAPTITLHTRSSRTYRYTIMPAIGTLRLEVL